jgi:hypothetical protein
MLEVGTGGLIPTEEQTQMTLWAEMASPILLSTDLAKLTPAEVAIVGNPDVVAVDQDRLGAQGTIVQSGPGHDVAGSGVMVTVAGHGSNLAFLGSEAGFDTDTVGVTYTDGTSTSGTLGFPNWCCDSPTDHGATPAIVTTHRNTPSGPANFGIDYDVFYNAIPFDPAKTVKTVTLPNDQAIHIFALTVQP